MVRPDPILGYDVVIPAGSAVTITYRIDVAPDTDDADLLRWKDEATAEWNAYQARGQQEAESGGERTG